MVRRMRRHLFVVVVLGVLLLRSASMYPGLDVCGGGVRLYQVMLIFALYIKRGGSLFRCGGLKQCQPQQGTAEASVQGVDALGKEWRYVA